MNDIESLGRPGAGSGGFTITDSIEQPSTYDLNRVTEDLIPWNSSTFVSANILRNQLRGLSDHSGLHTDHILRSCRITDFSHTGAARTFKFDIQTLATHKFFLAARLSVFGSSQR